MPVRQGAKPLSKGLHPVSDVFFIGGRWSREVFRNAVAYHRMLAGTLSRSMFIKNGHSGGVDQGQGTSNYEAMRPYVKIVDKLKSEAMQRFDAMKGGVTGHDSECGFCAG